ncbi:MAG: hypothetical protein HOE90_01980 [Bacteriovoracaceae bacterium]|nr:hypothetical protein [Bacteriovoracaceae bacterium]
METKLYRVNIDYEAALGDPQYQKDSEKYQKLCREWEWIFLWCGDADQTLASCRQKKYSEDYLAFVKKMRGFIPAVEYNALKSENWWGKLQNLKLEKTLNSKVFSSNLLKEIGVDIPGCGIAHSAKEAQQILTRDSTSVFKKNLSFSGKGHLFIEDKLKIDAELSRGEMVYNPWFERVSDFSILFRPMGERHHFIQKISNRGNYQGSTYLENQQALADHLKSQLINDNMINWYFEKIDLIYKKVQGLSGIEDPIFGIDSFLYRENETSKVFPMCEINYRRSLNGVLYSLSKTFNSSKSVSAQIYRKSEQKGPSGIIVSPKDNLFTYYLQIA